MVTLLYGIAIGFFVYRAFDEIKLMIYRRRLKKEQERFRQALDGFGLTIRQFFHRIEDDLERQRQPELSIEEQIVIAIENQDFEEAARLRDKLKNEKLR